MTARAIFEAAVDAAILKAGDYGVRLYFARERGEPIPADLRPGAWLERLSPEKRAELAKLTSDQTSKYRI